LSFIISNIVLNRIVFANRLLIGITF